MIKARRNLAERLRKGGVGATRCSRQVSSFTRHSRLIWLGGKGQSKGKVKLISLYPAPVPSVPRSFPAALSLPHSHSRFYCGFKFTSDLFVSENILLAKGPDSLKRLSSLPHRDTVTPGTPRLFRLNTIKAMERRTADISEHFLPYGRGNSEKVLNVLSLVLFSNYQQ